MLIASVVSLGTGAAASAQTLKPEPPDRSAPALVPLAPTVPGRPPAIGVPLDVALAAAQALSGPQRGAAIDRSAPLGGGGIVAVFIAPVQVLVVIGNAQDNTIRAVTV